MLEYWFILPTAIIIATLVSSIGIGGGILWMPFFLIVLKLPADVSVLTSLIIQSAGMGSASFTCIKQQRVDFKFMLLIIAIAAPGVIGGAFLAGILKSQTTQLILGLLIMTTALLFVASNPKYNDLGGDKVNIKAAYKYLWIILPASMGSGMLSTSMSEWLIPIMRSKLALKMSHAIGTSLAITFFISLLGVMTHSLMGNKAQMLVVLWAVPGVIIGGQIGARFSKRINERLLKEAFVFFLTLVGIHLVYSSY